MLLLTGAVLARGKHDPTPAAPGFVESAVDELLLGITPRAGIGLTEAEIAFHKSR